MTRSVVAAAPMKEDSSAQSIWGILSPCRRTLASTAFRAFAGWTMPSPGCCVPMEHQCKPASRPYNPRSMIEQVPDSAAQDAHLRLLSLIEQHPHYSQRRLAEAMGVSLGKTHYLIKALFEKGLVKAGRFANSQAKLQYVYALTPDGMRHRMHLTRGFLQRKEQEYEQLRSEIEQLRKALCDDVSGRGGPVGDSML